jgi:signal transduction histidine kinase
MEWVDLHAGLESTLNVVANEIKYKAEIVRDYGSLPRVECRPSQINQVFMNLLVNAAQAIPQKGRITLKSGCADEQVWISVSDTGSGIPPEIMARIFDPFFTTKPVGKGTGLGLSVSYGIIEKHGGRIEVASQPGEGTTFTVRLPTRQPEATPSA